MAESPATLFSAALCEEFVRLGVRDIVVSPGSRSQAPALVAAELEAIGAVRLHVRIDERVAAFCALGLAVETGFPALVVTSSGTAVANLHPAVLEAHHSRVPLIALTADRPEELRGIRSNQTTTVQPGIYGGAVRLSESVPAPFGGSHEDAAAKDLARRAWSAACGWETRNPGPVQLNLAFGMPLASAVPPLSVPPSSVAVVAFSPTSFAPPAPAGQPPTVTAPGVENVPSAEDSIPHTPLTPPVTEVVTVGGDERTVVIAGHDAGAQAEEFARQGGWPLLAEITSGARFGPNLIVAVRELLGDAKFGGRVVRAIIFGHPTLSREVPALVQRSDVRSIVVSPFGTEWFNPGHRVGRFARRATVEPGPHNFQWLEQWVLANRRFLDAYDDDVFGGGPAERSHGLDEEAGPREGVGPGAEVGLDGSVDSEGRVRLGGGVGAGNADPLSRLAGSAEGGGWARQHLSVLRAAVTRRMLVSAVWRATWPHDRLVLAASRLIREADRIVSGKKIRAHANRGLSGIDGTISTGLGIAIAQQSGGAVQPGVTRVVLGDLAFLHDVGGLLIGEGEMRPRIQVIVGNDGGGTIFDSLEVAAYASESSMRRVMYTPQTVNIEALADAYGWAFMRATTRAQLDEALMAPVMGPMVIEVPLARVE